VPVSFRIGVLCAVVSIAAVCAAASGAAIPSTGQALPQMAPVDNAVVSMMERYAIPGAALAVVHQGRLVYARGYGYADREAGTLAQPDSRFRIASISKPITAAAILTLVDAGKLSLGTKVFSLLADLQPVPGATLDPRLGSITVKELLQHQGGWDRGASFDPMFRAREAAAAVGAPSPGDCTTIIRWMLGFPLDFTPGTKSVYSNFGYCVLGRVIEHASGMTYGAYVRQAVLAPLGMAATELGHTVQPLPGEVRYYDVPNAGLGTSVFDGVSLVPRPYGSFHLEAMDSHGGWVSTPSDLLRLLTGLNETRGKLLSGNYSWSYNPIPPRWSPGFGAWGHEGALLGAYGIAAVAGENGWALLTNTYRYDTDFVQADPLFWDMKTALDSIASWPSGDLFTTTPGHTLTVTKAGSGFGRITSSSGGIDCGFTCTWGFGPGVSVTLTATPAYGSTFAGWSNGCTGTGACVVTMHSDLAPVATFEALCVVPRVIRKTLAAARSALAGAHCSVGSVRRAYSPKVPKGRVVSQHPAAGTSLSAGSPVDLVASKGRRKH
jgi:CubicO group peptidase (beta-lactamase class C family)